MHHHRPPANPGRPAWSGALSAALPEALRAALIARLFTPSAESLRYYARHDQYGDAIGQVVVNAPLCPGDGRAEA